MQVRVCGVALVGGWGMSADECWEMGVNFWVLKLRKPEFKMCRLGDFDCLDPIYPF